MNNKTIRSVSKIKTKTKKKRKENKMPTKTPRTIIINN